MQNHQQIPGYLSVSPVRPVPWRPWWKQPVMLLPVGVAAVAVAFFIGVAVGKSSSSTDTLPSSTQTQDERSSTQPQGGQPAGVSAAQKSQILSKFCNQQAGGPYNVSEAALLECTNSFYVTEQGQVLPK
ncbi:hypothetical protein OG772_20710 [Streptomyces sp. NBC_01321]|uniref:hypothetical protein n=1 Tax=Streptomyces sp. NBC_01321 TaxID=2903825 RepID=UPI002E14A654|nr:hypothetical protein OG772_20710 [Streptomyces sp. NBC_01321]